MAIYPERPIYSPWSDIGSALTQGAGIVGQFDQSRNALQALVDKRAEAAMERQRQQRDDAMKAKEFAMLQDRYAREQMDKELQTNRDTEFSTYAQGDKTEVSPASSLPYAAPGLGPNNETSMQVPAQYSTRPRTRQELVDKALELRQISPDKYMDATKPETGLTLEDRISLATTQAGLRPPSAGSRDRFSVQVIDGRKVKVNLDTDEQTDMGPAPTTQGGAKDLSAAEIEKLSELGDKKNQVDTMVNSFKDDFAGFGNGVQNTIGKYTGTSKDQVIWWQNYASFVNKVRNDLFGAALTPGEKAEFEKTKISTGTAPDIVRANLAEQARIVKAAIERRRGVYTAGRRVNQDQVNAAFGATPSGTAPAQAKDGERKTNTSGRPIIFRGGRWVAE